LVCILKRWFSGRSDSRLHPTLVGRDPGQAKVCVLERWFSGRSDSRLTSKYTHIGSMGTPVAAFVSDGKLDWEVARHFGIPFVYVPMHSAWADGEATCEACPHSTVCRSWAAVDDALRALAAPPSKPVVAAAAEPVAAVCA
jgi:hypothetical protein